MEQPHLLLINPWIYDFAAYDLWMKPLGILNIASAFREQGYKISFIDCLDRYNPMLLKFQNLENPNNKKYGCGHFLRTEVKKPDILNDIQKKYCCYGITEEIFTEELKNISPPDAILVTSMMTYWYPGVFRAIELLKNKFPKIPVILGGIYATLCHSHALNNSGADFVFNGNDINGALALINKLTGIENKFRYSISELPSPAFDLYQNIDYACISTSFGCPYQCTYCASKLLYPDFIQRKPETVVSEIEYFYKKLGVKNFAFYDDALLVNSDKHIEKILDGIISLNINSYFHTPNGIHPRLITESLAKKLFNAGFKTLRLSLETADKKLQIETGNKVTNEEFEEALIFLKTAGFGQNELGAYIFMGYPGQDKEEVNDSINYVTQKGIRPFLVEYSPIPGTFEWDRMIGKGIIKGNIDPLLHNNSVFLRKFLGWEESDLQKIKAMVRSRG